MSKHHVSTTINGEPTEFLCEPQLTLLDVLRDELQLDRQQRRLQLGRLRRLQRDRRRPLGLLVPDACGRGRRSRDRDDRGHGAGPRSPSAAAKFLEYAALQCGFCTPGVLVAAKALLDRNPNPTETETRYWLAGNLCRCTGYDKIVRAVLDAAAELRGAIRGCLHKPMNATKTGMYWRCEMLHPDFIAAERSEWNPETLEEEPCDVKRVLRLFEDANKLAEFSARIEALMPLDE